VSLNCPRPGEVSSEERDLLTRQIEDRVLSALPAEAFKLRNRDGFLVGYTKAQGLAKLAEHGDVRAVSLQVAYPYGGTPEMRVREK
jgi:hypothetical protein